MAYNAFIFYLANSLITVLLVGSISGCLGARSLLSMGRCSTMRQPITEKKENYVLEGKLLITYLQHNDAQWYLLLASDTVLN
jgi:hypothetical protein